MDALSLNKDLFNRDLRLWAVGVSLLMSLWTILLPHLPNPDAYLYVRGAGMILDGDIAAAYRHYPWASYSVLIAAVGSMGLDLFLAAHLINGLFHALLVYAFLSIAREISIDPLFGLFAALCILLYPELNEKRYLIIRDTGFWALVLWALVLLIRFSRSGGLATASAFSLTLLAAAALRPEGLVYLALLPLSLIFSGGLRPAAPESDGRDVADTGDTGETGGRGVRLVLLAKLYAAAALFMLGGLLLSFLLSISVLDLLHQFFAEYLLGLNNALNPDPATLSDRARAVFGDYAATFSQKHLGLFTAAGLLAITALYLAKAVGGPYCWLLLYGFLRRRLVPPPRSVAAPAVTAALINLAILLVFVFIARFLTTRYAMVLAVLMVLLVAGVLTAIVNTAKARRGRLLWGGIAFFFFYCAVDSFISFGDPRKEYITAAGNWIHDDLRMQGDLITNSTAIAYLSGRVIEYDQMERNFGAKPLNESEAGDIIAIVWSFEAARLLERHFNAGQLQPLAEFGDDEGRVLIYRRL